MSLGMLSHAQPSRRWWAEAVNTAVNTLNRIVHSKTGDESPHEIITGNKSSLRHMRVSGCKAYNLMQKPESRDKMAAKAIAPGDQVRLSYDDAGGGNLSKTFKKAEGC